MPLGGLVVLATVLAYVSGIVAARALGSKVASFVSLTEVLFAVIWAWLLLGELPGAIQLLGGVLIVGGVVLVRLDELRSSGRPPHRPAPYPPRDGAGAAGSRERRRTRPLDGRAAEPRPR